MLAEEKETNFEDLDASTDAGSELPELLGWKLTWNHEGLEDDFPFQLGDF